MFTIDRETKKDVLKLVYNCAVGAAGGITLGVLSNGLLLTLVSNFSIPRKAVCVIGTLGGGFMLGIGQAEMIEGDTAYEVYDAIDDFVDKMEDRKQKKAIEEDYEVNA